MLLAISHESFWIDELWNVYFASLESVGQLFEALLAPYGSQTPLHFIYSYIWGHLFSTSEFVFRLSNLPLFVLGQACLFWALRSYPRPFGYALLILSALHPMVWQYANELRPYIMMYAGAQMILAYILHINASNVIGGSFSPIAPIIFAVGGILLFGASLIGAFWVGAALIYIGHFHYRRMDLNYLTRRSTLLFVGVFIVINGMLTIYYLNSLLQGGGGSRLASTTPKTLLFNAYELLGMSGIGPGRLELREVGIPSLSPYWGWLAIGFVLILAPLVMGIHEAKRTLGTRFLIVAIALGVMPIAIVVFSGFVMHWRVLGRHMFPAIPLLNILLALGLAKLCERGRGSAWSLRSVIAVGFLLTFVYSAVSLRFSERHRKDDYMAAAAIAKQGLADGKRVWWAASALGARHYDITGDFDYMGELTNIREPYVCIDHAGVQSVSEAAGNCLEQLKSPDLVILSKPDTFDFRGLITAYLKAGNFVKTAELPAFTIWQPATARKLPLSESGPDQFQQGTSRHPATAGN